MIVTRKIELYVDAEPERKQQVYSFIRSLQRESWLLANKAISLLWFYHFLEENQMRFDEAQLAKLNELIAESTDEKVRKGYQKERSKLLNEARKAARQKLRKTFEVTYQTLTRRALGAETMQAGGAFDLKGGCYLLDGLMNRITQDFSNDLVEVKQGKKSIRNYRSGLPVFFHNRAIKKFEQGEKEGQYYLHWLNGIRFGLVFGRDKNSRSSEIKKIIDGEYGYGDSALQLKGKKLYLLLSLKHPEQPADVLPDRAIEVDAGMLVPVKCKYGDKLEQYGSAEDLLRFRIQKQIRYSKLQKALKINQGGRGRKKKLAKLEDMVKAERNFIKTYNHKLSTAVIKYAVKNRAGKIVVNELKFSSSDDPEEQQKFEARNWAGHELSTMIQYKAKLHGIETYIQKAQTAPSVI